MNNVYNIHFIFNLHHKNKPQKFVCFIDKVTFKKSKIMKNFNVPIFSTVFSF